MLWSLAREGDTHLRELARRASVDPSHVSRLATRLEHDGLLRRQPDPDDGRQMRFFITAKGRALYRKLRPKALRVSAQFQDLYTASEYATLMALLERAIAHADTLLAQDRSA